MILGTTYVRKDEPCLGLYELNFRKHRHQIIVVMRGDRGDQPAEYRKDLGNVNRFKGVDQFRIPGGTVVNNRYQIAHTAGQLIDIANQLRAQKTLFDKKEILKVNKFKE